MGSLYKNLLRTPNRTACLWGFVWWFAFRFNLLSFLVYKHHNEATPGYSGVAQWIPDRET